MPTVSRQAFIEGKPQLDLSTISNPSWEALAAHGVKRSSLEAIAGGDRVISGEQESGALYDLMFARSEGGGGVDLSRSEAVYQILQAELLAFSFPAMSFQSSARVRTTGIFAASASRCALECHGSGDAPGEAVERFRETLKARAVDRLEAHQEALAAESDRYLDQSDANPAWDRLERAAEALHEIDAWEQMQRADPGCGSASCHTGDLVARLAVADQAKVMRAELIEAVPALSVLDSYDLANLGDRASTAATIRRGLDGYRDQIDGVIGRLDHDIPLSKLGDLVGEVMQEYNISEEARALGDPTSVEVMDWLEGQEQTEAILQWSALGGSVCLGIGAFLVPELAVPLGLAGAGIGFGDAAYSYEVADDVYDAATASPFERDALADPAEARFDYAMATVSLGMAGVDLAQAGWAVKAMGATRALDTVAPTARVGGAVADAEPEVVAALLRRGVHPDTVGRIARGAEALDKGSSERLLAYLATRDAAEIEAAEKMIQLELADGGHSIARHGPHLSADALEDRLTTARAPDGSQSAAPASTRFTSFQRMLRAREAAETAFRSRAAANGWDLSLGPGQGRNPPQMNGEVTVDFGKPIGRGYLPASTTTTRNAVVLDDGVMVSPKNITELARERVSPNLPKAQYDAAVAALVNDPKLQAEFMRMRLADGAKVYDATAPAGDLVTRSYTKFVFENGRWSAAQHFPLAADSALDPLTGAYLRPADVMLRR